MKQRRSGIHPLVGIVILLLLAIGSLLVGRNYVNNARQEFLEAEKDLPESAISIYLEQIKQKNFDGIYEDSLVVAPHINSKEDYVAKLEEIYGDIDFDKIEFAPTDDSEGAQKYVLAYEGKYLATLELIKTSDGRWLSSTLFSGDNNYVVEVPTGLSITVNGIEIDDSYKTQENIVATNFKGLKDTSSAPHVDQYALNNLLGEPKIEVVGQSGYGTVKDVITNTILVGKVVNDETIKNTMISHSKTCAQWPAQEAGLGAVGNVVITNSDFYDRVRTLQNNWFTAHGTSYFSNEDAFQIIAQSDDSVVGYVVFDYYASNGEVDRTWNAGYQVSMLNVNGTWKIAGMGIDSRLNPNKTEHY